jgi:SAM-dependent methyltransferase
MERVEVTSLIDPSNADIARGWDGPSGDYWVQNADLLDGSVARYTEPFLAAAAIAADALVLDVGCGNGETTLAAAERAPAGEAVGVDLSARMLDVARRRAALQGLDNVTFIQADAQVADLGAGRFDRVISRTGAMFFGNPVAAFANLARALRPDGLLVLLVWQPLSENEWLNVFFQAVAPDRPVPVSPPGAPGPFSLGEPARLRSVLAAAGFGEPRLVGLREPLWFGPDVARAEALVLGLVGGVLADLDDAGHAAALAALRATLEAHLGPDGVLFGSAAWLVTAEPVGQGRWNG